MLVCACERTIMGMGEEAHSVFISHFNDKVNLTHCDEILYSFIFLIVGSLLFIRKYTT